MSLLAQDLRYGLRTLLKTPGFTAVAILTLGLGIGANTAIFSFLDGILLKPLPYADSDRIVRVLEKPPGGGINGISTLNFLDWKKQNTVFEMMAAEGGGSVTLSGRNEAEQFRTARVSDGYFGIFRLSAAMGRTFLPGEDQAGKDHVVILSYPLWRDRFGADPALLNRTILLDNEPYTVVGILPAGSAFDRAGTQIWLPLTFQPSNMTRNFHWFVAFARLKPGVPLEQARKEMDLIGAQIAAAYPDSNKGWGVAVDRYSDIIIGPDLRTALLVLISATGMVLLIGCANLANLALARGVAREREVAVRAALGAGRWRLMRQFLTESVLVSICGGTLGIGIGFATMKYLMTLVSPGDLPREVNVALDGRVLLFALAISIATGLLFGLAPALHATSPELGSSMKDGGRGASAGAARRRLRDVLVVAEISLAFVLLVGSGLMIKSFFRLINVDLGFDSTKLLSMSLQISDKQYPETARLNGYLSEIQAAVGAVPGVKQTALTCAPPLQGTCYRMPMQVANRPAVDRANRRGGFFKIVSASYFQTLGIKMLRGRALDDHDRKGSAPAMVINERLAARDFPNQDPVGQHILIQEIVPGKTELGPEIPWEVVGVMANEKVNGLNDEKSAGVYVSNEQSPAYGMNLIVRGGVDPLKLQNAITAAIHSVNKDQAVSDIRTMQQIKSEDSLGDAIEAGLLVVFGTIAFLLAAIGIYGVMSYAVIQRTHEIGIRAALGASAESLLQLILYRGMALTGIGLAIGAVGALALTRAMATMLYGVGVRDPVTMISVAAILASAALAACYVPARRATLVDPIVALRHE